MMVVANKMSVRECMKSERPVPVSSAIWPCRRRLRPAAPVLAMVATMRDGIDAVVSNKNLAFALQFTLDGGLQSEDRGHHKFAPGKRPCDGSVMKRDFAQNPPNAIYGVRGDGRGAHGQNIGLAQFLQSVYPRHSKRCSSSRPDRDFEFHVF